MDNTKTLHGLYLFTNCSIPIQFVYHIGVGLYVLLSYQVWGYF